MLQISQTGRFPALEAHEEAMTSVATATYAILKVFNGYALARHGHLAQLLLNTSGEFPSWACAGPESLRNKLPVPVGTGWDSRRRSHDSMGRGHFR